MSGYISPAKRAFCAGCGKVVHRSQTSAAVQRCLDCRRRNPARPAKTSVTRWTCAWCGKECERPPTKGQSPKWCSESCGNIARVARRNTRRGEFNITRARRRRLYERDAWTCQICGEETLREWVPGDGQSPTLDHIEPQSHTLVPDHSDENLRTAHWRCNSLRSDGRMTDAQVAALVAERRLGDVAA